MLATGLALWVLWEQSSAIPQCVCVSGVVGGAGGQRAAEAIDPGPRPPKKA